MSTILQIFSLKALCHAVEESQIESEPKWHCLDILNTSKFYLLISNYVFLCFMLFHVYYIVMNLVEVSKSNPL